jgi:hypothetical protein
MAWVSNFYAGVIHPGREGAVPARGQVPPPRGRQLYRPPLPAAPTAAAPGTPEKLAALERRAELRQAMFHPADARYAGDPRPQQFLAATGVPPTDPAA